MKTQTNDLVRLANPLFELAHLFEQSNRFKNLANEFRQSVIDAFYQFEHAAMKLSVETDKILSAKYALTAFFDELIMSHDWEHRQTWIIAPLQLSFFGERCAGEGFFSRLIEIRQRGINYLDILEIYYLCLTLGFEGMYRRQGLEKLLGLKADLLNQIKAARGDLDKKLSVTVVQAEKHRSDRRNIPSWIIVSVTCAYLLFIYLTFSVAIDREAKNSLIAINRSLDQLSQDNR